MRTLWISTLVLLLLVGCSRHYHVQIFNVGDKNEVNIEVKADVPKTTSTDAILDVAP